MVDPQWLVTTSVTSLVALGGLYVNLSNNHRESKKYRSESNEFLRNISNNISNISKDIEELKVKNLEQDKIINLTREMSHAQLRHRLYQNLTLQLERGYTTVADMTEIIKMYESYKHDNGNGEIEYLFNKVEKLPYDKEE